MKVYCSTFGKKVFSKKVIPIEVGASERSEFVYDLHDDSGDNISKENKYFGELTGIYWIWKNCKYKDDEIIGFCHYNKSLQISKKNAKIFLDNNRGGWITLKPCKIRDHPVSIEVKAIEDVLKLRPTKYYESWTKMYDSVAEGKFECCRGANMFVTTYKEFSEYCKWLFDILFEMRKIVGDKLDTDKNMQRYCAFMGERLLSVYIDANSKPVMGVPTKYARWWLPICRKIVKIFKIDKELRIYKVLKNKIGYSSQYGRR